MAKLGDIFVKQIVGEWGNECNNESNGVFVLRTTNFSNSGVINYDKVVKRDIPDNKVEEKKLKYGDIILEKSGGTDKTPVGRVVFCDNKIESDVYLCNNFTQAMRVDNSIAIPKYVFYLMYYFHQIGITDLLQSKTTGIRNLRLRDYLNTDIKLPNLAEQEHCVIYLDKLTVLIFLRQQQLEKLDELVKSRFIEMFGDPVANSKNWNISSLLSIGYCKNGMNFHTGDNGVDIRCLGVADFKNLSVIDGTENLPIVSLNELPSKDSMLKDGDIVFVRSNGNKALVGRCLLVYPHNIPTTYSGFCIRFRLTSKQVMPEYLLRVLKSDSISKKMMGRGANIQNLNQQILASLDIPIPPLDLQNQFAEFVKQTDKSKVAVQKSLEQLETLKKSLMQKYFG